LTEGAERSVSPADTGDIGAVLRATTAKEPQVTSALTVDWMLPKTVAAAGTPYGGGAWRLIDMKARKQQNLLDIGIPGIKEEDASQELLDIPGFYAKLLKAEQQVERGETIKFDDIRRNV